MALTIARTRADLFEQLDGRAYTLDGISGTLRFQTYRAIYPYAHTVEKLEHQPDARGQQTPEYQAMKRQLGDDWMSDLTENPTTLARIAQELGIDF